LNPYLNSRHKEQVGSYLETREDGVRMTVHIWRHKTSGGYAFWETRQETHKELTLF
jgi:hypothetical protein